MGRYTCCCRWYSAPEVTDIRPGGSGRSRGLIDRGCFCRYPAPMPSRVRGDALPVGPAALTRGLALGRLRPPPGTALLSRRRWSRRIRGAVAQRVASLDAEGQAQPRNVGRLPGQHRIHAHGLALAGWLFTVAGPTALATIAAAVLVLSVVVVLPIPGVADLGNPATPRPRNDATASMPVAP